MLNDIAWAAWAAQLTPNTLGIQHGFRFPEGVLVHRIDWLYAALRAHYGTGVKTAMIAGFAWWILASMQSAKWLVLSPIPPRTAVLPGLLTLPSILIAAGVGGWCYESFRWRRPARAATRARTSGSPDA